MSQPPPVLPYDQHRVCGRVMVTGSGDQMTIIVRANWRAACVLFLLSITAAVIGWLSQWAFRDTHMIWASLGMFLGYTAAIVLVSNAIGQSVRVQRVELSVRRLTVSGRGSTASFLRDEIAGIAAGSARHPLGYDSPSVNASLRNGAEVAILLATRNEAAFAAEVLRSAMGLAADPFHAELLNRIAGPDVAVHACASGVMADLQRRPSIVEAPIISLSAGALGAWGALSLLGDRSAIYAVGISIVLGYQGWRACVRLSPSITVGIWDGEFIFAERQWMRKRAQLRYGRQDVAGIRLAPAATPQRSRLCIVLSTGEEVFSERTWPTLKLQALVNTVDEARRLCP